MAYFKEYYNTLKDLKDQVYSDVDGVENDKQLIGSMLNFAKEVGHLMMVAGNNSAIEGKASRVPKDSSNENSSNENSSDENSSDENSNTENP